MNLYVCIFNVEDYFRRGDKHLDAILCSGVMPPSSSAWSRIGLALWMRGMAYTVSCQTWRLANYL